MARKSAQSDIIQAYAIQQIVAGHRVTDIVNTLKATYKLTTNTSERHVKRAKQAIAKLLPDIAEYRPIIIARYEQQYKDCEQIEKTETKVRLQRDINDSMARLTGADQPAPRSVNIFQFFPDRDSTGRIKVDIPAEYTIDAPETAQDAPGDDLDDAPIRMMVPGGAR
ncbi:MAG: hypothetical protein WC455_16610 [Dehalococcoidia bacterium]|jgi:hypothetical protein